MASLLGDRERTEPGPSRKLKSMRERKRDREGEQWEAEFDLRTSVKGSALGRRKRFSNRGGDDAAAAPLAVLPVHNWRRYVEQSSSGI